jgi:hypothetical protein
METVLKGYDLATLGNRITQKTVAVGELLWQGGAGFCIATAASTRNPGNKQHVGVLKLRQLEKTRFGASFLVPVAGLLADGVLDEAILSSRDREELVSMVEALQAGLSMADVK